MTAKACPRGTVKIGHRCKPRYCAEIISGFGIYPDIHSEQCFTSLKIAEERADSLVSEAESWRIRDRKTGKIVSTLEWGRE